MAFAIRGFIAIVPSFSLGTHEPTLRTSKLTPPLIISLSRVGSAPTNSIVSFLTLLFSSSILSLCVNISCWEYLEFSNPSSHWTADSAPNDVMRFITPVVSILADHLRNTHLRVPYHPSPATRKAHHHSLREVEGVFKELITLAKPLGRPV